MLSISLPFPFVPNGVLGVLMESQNNLWRSVKTNRFRLLVGPRNIAWSLTLNYYVTSA